MEEKAILVEELDPPLAECKAIMFAARNGYRLVEILKRERVEGAWRFSTRLQPLSEQDPYGGIGQPSDWMR